jgi:hypothetical protein
MGGGSGWIVTGRYDAESGTGDEDFPGHACGGYPDSPGRYGIVSDDAYAFDAPYLHMGIAVDDATDFEIEYLEIARSGFAGVRLLNDPDDGIAQPMANVKVHDLYVHDTGAEGLYFGWTGDPPSDLMPGLEVYNNRFVRTGNDAIQLQDVGDGSRIHHNTVLSSGTRWLDNDLGKYQDNLVQLSIREGTVEVDHNVLVDSGGSLISFWTQPQDGDGDRHLSFHDNYLAGGINLPIFVGGEADGDSSFTFADNVFRDFEFAYDRAYPAETDPGILLGYDGDVAGPIAFTGNAWSGDEDVTYGLPGDGTQGPVTATDNDAGAHPAIELVDAGDYWSRPGRHLTKWAPIATVDETDPAVTFDPDDVVTWGEAPDLYVCTEASGGVAPDEAPAAWTKLARPADDVRVVEETVYADLGVR